MSQFLQRTLLIIGVIALIALVGEIVLSIAATMHGSTPVRIVEVQAGPYQLKVSLYTYPANAGFALPFAVAPLLSQESKLTFKVMSVPGRGVHATPVKASIYPDSQVPAGIQGSAEITVQGPWTLQMIVEGAQGQGTANIAVQAVALPPLPLWLGWLIGLVPGAIFTFLLWQWRRIDLNVSANLA